MLHLKSYSLIMILSTSGFQVISQTTDQCFGRNKDTTQPITIFSGYPWEIKGVNNTERRVLRPGRLKSPPGIYNDDGTALADTCILQIFRDTALFLKTTKEILPDTTVFDSTIHEKIYKGFNAPLVQAFSAGTKPQKEYNALVLRPWDFDDDYAGHETNNPPPENISPGVKAKMILTQRRYHMCNTLVTIRDTSLIKDSIADRIVKWTVDWGDHGLNSVQHFQDSFPANLSHEYTQHGSFTVKLKVETARGNTSWAANTLSIYGPVAFFDTTMKRQYCVGEKVVFKNMSQYLAPYRNGRQWNFGDYHWDSRHDTVPHNNDTVSHRYMKAGTYHVFLENVVHYPNQTLLYVCYDIFPDTNMRQQELFSIEIVDCQNTEVKTVPKESIKMYPNPAHSFLTIASDEMTEIIITDAMGKTIRTFFNEGEQTIDLRNLSRGLYIVRTANKEVVGKLVVE